MTGIIDRIVENIVVLEVEGEMLNIERTKFPEDIKEGDIVRKDGDNFIILKGETKERKKYIDNLFKDLIKEKNNNYKNH